MKDSMTAPSVLGDIQAEIQEAKKAAEKELYSALSQLLKAIQSDAELIAWLYGRRKCNAGENLTGALQRPVEHTLLMGHTPGSNKILSFSVFWDKDGTPTGVGIVVDNYWYQGEHNPGQHWYQILQRTGKAPVHETRHYFSGSGDSHWVALMSARITEDTAHAVLQDFMKFKIEFEEKYGKDS